MKATIITVSVILVIGLLLLAGKVDSFNSRLTVVESKTSGMSVK